jgi:hypothetical protein
MRQYCLLLLAVLLLSALVSCAADRDQSTALTHAINQEADGLRRTNQARVSFSYQPKSTMGRGDGQIGDYTVILRGTSGNGQVKIIEKGGQDHSTFQFPRVVVPNGLIEVSKTAGAPLAIVLTRAGDNVELTDMR